MKQTILCLWRDQRGFTVSSELILVATIVVLGMIVGLATFRDSIVQELGDAASAIAEFNQSYNLDIDLDANTAGDQNTRTFTFGVAPNQVAITITIADSVYTDNLDFCQVTPDPNGNAPACLQMNVATNNQETQPSNAPVP